MLIKRFISAAIMTPLAVVGVLLGGWWFTGAALVVSAIVLHEWYSVTGAKALWAATAALVAIWVAAAYHGSVGLAAYLLIMGVIGSAFLCLVRGSEELARWAGLGLIYVAVPMVALIWLIKVPDGSWLVLWLLIVIWVTDSAAFAVGRLVGGPKLAPSISPGKTWAGAAGGLVVAIVVAAVATRYMLAMDTQDAIILAAVMSIIAQLGDLAESWVKRRCNKKDSGALIPGHGGAMDRFDGLITTAPVLAVIVAFSPGFANAVMP